MKIIQERANSNGYRPPIQPFPGEAPDGYVGIPDDVDTSSMQEYMGFVDLNVRDGFVVSMTGNEEGKLKYLESLPPVDPSHPPTEAEQLRADVDFLAAMTGVAL